MRLSESNQKSYLYPVVLSVLYTNLEICCAIILGSFIRKYIDFYEAEKQQDDKYENFIEIIISYLNRSQRIIQKIKFKEIVNQISMFNQDDGKIKYLYGFMFVHLIALVFCEMEFEKFCALQSNDLFSEVNNKMINVSFVYFERKEFINFLKDNLYTIVYDHGINMMNLCKIFYMFILCVFLIVRHKITNKLVYIFLFCSLGVSFVVYRYLYKTPQYNLNVNDNELFQHNMQYFHDAQEKSYYIYHSVLHGLILIAGYVMIIQYNQKDQYLSIFLMYNFFVLIFSLKSVAMNFMLGGYMKNIITNIPVYSAPQFEIHRLDSIECINGQVNVSYEGISVHFVRDLSLKLSSGNLYIIKSGGLGRGVFLNYLMQHDQNNSHVFVNIGDQQYPIGRVTNLTQHCQIFDQNSIDNETNTQDEYDLLSDPFDIKLKKLHIITGAVKSDIRFIGLDMTLFTDFNSNEMINVLNWIDKNRTANKCIVITLDDNILLIGQTNGLIYRINDCILERIK